MEKSEQGKYIPYCTQYNMKNMIYIDLLLANQIAHISVLMIKAI